MGKTPTKQSNRTNKSPTDNRSTARKELVKRWNASQLEMQINSHTTPSTGVSQIRTVPEEGNLMSFNETEVNTHIRDNRSDSEEEIVANLANADLVELERVYKRRIDRIANKTKTQLAAHSSDNLLVVRREIKMSQDITHKLIESHKTETDTRINSLVQTIELMAMNCKSEGIKYDNKLAELEQKIESQDQMLQQIIRNDLLTVKAVNECIVDIEEMKAKSQTITSLNEQRDDISKEIDLKVHSLTTDLKKMVSDSSKEFRQLALKNVDDLRSITKEAVTNMSNLKSDLSTRLAFCEDRLEAMEGDCEEQSEASYKAFQTKTKTTFGAEENDLQSAPNKNQMYTHRKERSNSKSSTPTVDLNEYRPTHTEKQFDTIDPQQRFYVEILKRLEDTKEKGANDIRIESFKLNDCAKTWIEEFQRKARYSKLAERKWKDVVGKHMAIAHGPTYDNLYQQHYDMCWLDFKILFIETFQTQEAVSIARMDLERLNFEEFKDKDAFFEKCYTLVDTIGNTDGASIAMSLMNKFSPEIRRRVHIQGLNHKPREIIRNFRSAWYSERQISEEESRKKKDSSSNQSNQQSNQQFKKPFKTNDNTKFKPNNGQKVFRNFDKPQINRPRCHFCNIPGHMEKECWKKASADRNQQSGSSGQSQQQTGGEYCVWRPGLNPP